MFLAEVEEPLVGSGAWTVWWSIIGGCELYWFCGYLLFATFAIMYWLQIREGSKIMICYCTSIIFRNWWMIEGHFYRLVISMFCWKRCMLSRFTVVVCVSIAVVGGKLRFLSGRPRDFRHWIFHHSFCFLGATDNLFYDCSRFGSLWEVFARGGEFPVAFLNVVGLGHGVEDYCWPVTVVTVLQRTREGVRLVFPIMTVSCRFGLSA